MQPLFSSRMSNRFPVYESRQRRGGGECGALNVGKINSNLTSGLAIAGNAPLRFREIRLIDFKPNKFLHAAALRCDRGITDAEKRIEHRLDARHTMQFDAPLSELDRKRRRVRAFFLTALNCFVGNEPRVPATTQIVPASMRPSRDIALVLIRNAKGQPVQFHTTGLREMKNVFVAIVEKPF